MRKYLLIIAGVCIYGMAMAQIGHGGVPYSFNKYEMQLTDVPVADVPAKSHALLIEEEQLQQDKSRAYKFGESIHVHYTPYNSGVWEQVSDGGRLWRLKIKSEGAYSLNFVFDSFYLPSHSKLYIYTADRQYVAGAFTAANNNATRDFATSLFPGDEVIMEYYEALGDKDSTCIVLSSVVHAYKNITGWGRSGSCNIDINCSQGRALQVQKRSVVLILRYGYAHCSGTLVNNVRQDGTPYVLTANHCVDGYESQLSRFVFVFNHEADTCGSTTTRTTYSINGATCVAKHKHSDFCLLLLSSMPTEEMHPYYAGWSAISELPIAACGIHHPNGDVKKVSVAKNKFSYSKYEAEDHTFPNNTHIELVWAYGTTEGGSSGSALFNQDRLVVGQLEGGYAACDYPEGEDLYGRLAYSWTNNNAVNNAERLDKWLDPDETGTLKLEGYAPYGGDSTGVREITPVTLWSIYPNPAAYKVTLQGSDENEVSYAVYDIKGVCMQQGALEGDNKEIDLSALSQGMYIIKVAGTATRGVVKVLIQR